MDPVRQLATPIAEVRAAAPVRVDEFGEAWIMLDGIETKCPSIKAARALCARQDALRVKIREDLDARGLRFNEDGTDREEQVEITLGDGTVTTVGLLKPGDSNYLQIGNFPDGEGLMRNAEAAQAQRDREAAEEAARVEQARKAALTPMQRIREGIAALFGKDKS